MEWIWQHCIHLFGSYCVDKSHTRDTPVTKNTKWSWRRKSRSFMLKRASSMSWNITEAGFIHQLVKIRGVLISKLSWKYRITLIEGQSQGHSYSMEGFSMSWNIIRVNLATLHCFVQMLTCGQASQKGCIYQLSIKWPSRSRLMSLIFNRILSRAMICIWYEFGEIGLMCHQLTNWQTDAADDNALVAVGPRSKDWLKKHLCFYVWLSDSGTKNKSTRAWESS